jgi:hypothetical protein
LMKARLREPSSILNLGLIIRCKRKNGKPWWLSWRRSLFTSCNNNLIIYK